MIIKILPKFLLMKESKGWKFSRPFFLNSGVWYWVVDVSSFNLKLMVLKLRTIHSFWQHILVKLLQIKYFSSTSDYSYQKFF